MAQESAFHQTMRAINYFKIESDGALFLGSPKEGSIKAYRAKVNPTKKADTGRELESVPWVIGESNPTTVTKAFRAKGNEPFWNLEICDTSITLNRMGETPLVFPKPEPKVEEKGIEIFTVKEDGVDLVVTIIDKISSDSMTGMPHPKTVVVEHKGAKLKGCGGDPVELLLGKEWIVEDLKGGAVVDGSSVSIQFKDGGWISGQASVNRYYAQYTLTGESLTISKVGTTRMAGDPALMKQESLFMRLLQDVQRFEIATDGALILHGATKGKITARRD
jgi:heat shock protein HslJ